MGRETRGHDNFRAGAILSESRGVEDQRDRLAARKMADAAKPVAAFLGESLGGKPSIGIGAQPLLGRKRITAARDDPKLVIGRAKSHRIACRRNRHIEGRPRRRAKEANGGKRNCRRAQKRRPPQLEESTARVKKTIAHGANAGRWTVEPGQLPIIRAAHMMPSMPRPI
jgi:hypothetical protein